MRKYYPKRGAQFSTREELEDKLIKSGWKFEGAGTSLSRGKITGFDVGVQDTDKDIWLMVYLKPVKDGLVVTKIKKEKISDYQPNGKYYNN